MAKQKHDGLSAPLVETDGSGGHEPYGRAYTYKTARRAKPSTTADGSFVLARSDRYGGALVTGLGDAKVSLADEGSYFSVMSPTPGTGIAQSIQTTFSATNGIFCLRNGPSAAVRVYPDYIRLICTVVGASTTRSEGLIAVDNIDRYSAGGSDLFTTPGIKNRNMDDSTASAVTVARFGALTLAAESAVRRLSRFQLRTAIMVAFEEWIIKFSGTDGAVSETMSGTAALRNTTYVGPVVLGAGHSLTLHLWNTANAVTAPSWEVEAGWWER